MDVMVGFWILCGLTVASGYMLDDLRIPVDRSIPRIRPLRRQIRHFEPGKAGEITVVYQTSQPQYQEVRWFRSAEGQPHANNPGYITTAGDPRYSYRNLTLSDVRAVTLRVQDVAWRDFPVTYLLSITIGRRVVIEYQLRTEIQRPTPQPQLTYLDEIRYVALPASPLSFSYNGFLAITCVAVVDSESSAFDLLQMYRMTFEKERLPPQKRVRGSKQRNSHAEVGNVTTKGMGRMLKNSFNSVEESGPYMTIYARTELPRQYIRYEITQRIQNASRKDEGAYACVMERAEDMLYASAWVREGPPTRHPGLEVIQCGSDTKTFKRKHDQDWDYRMSTPRGRETCVRCRAFAYPPPDLRLLRDGAEVTSDRTHHLDRYMNVADGGLEEITYTFRRPNHRDGGLYDCRAYYGDGAEQNLRFKLDIE